MGVRPNPLAQFDGKGDHPMHTPTHTPTHASTQ